MPRDDARAGGGPAGAGQREDRQGLPGLGQGQPQGCELRLARRRLHAAFLAALLGINNGVELKHVPYRARCRPWPT
jgi:hypothetical protein